MPVALTPAIVLSTLRYSETSKIVRLATRDLGVQSAIARGALRPKSRFGAALQVLSEGQAQLYLKDHRELHTLAAFDLIRVPVGIAADLERYAVASVLAEVMLRFAPADPHPASFDLLRDALGAIEAASADEVRAMGLHAVWQLVGSLGFAPSLDDCVHCGAPVPEGGDLAFSTKDGGVMCERCAGPDPGIRLPERARRDLAILAEPGHPLPQLDAPHFLAHQRLLARYIRYHLGEGAELPALDFWTRRPWTVR
ncbi:MAG TPA: DNA repair protein RecO [Gemmatimonadales bacterium]|jgi:DNA repair protein RecO (recombination protein O)